MGAEQGQGWLGRASGREVGGGSCVEQRDRSVAMRSATRAMGREGVGVKTIATSTPHHRIAAYRRHRRSLTLDAAAAQSLTYLGHVRRRPKLFWPRLF